MIIKKVFMRAVLSVFLVFLCSCASVGTNFTPPSPDKLEIGKMKLTDAISLFGKPDISSIKTTTNGIFHICKYNYSQANLAVVSSRVLLLEFKEDKLNGYFCWSSFKEDKSSFDSKTVDKIKMGVGELTKDDVMALLGKPEGKALCPSAISDFKDKCEKNAEVWGWYMSDNVNLWAERDIKSAELIVSFNSSGKVSGVDMEEYSYKPLKRN